MADISIYEPRVMIPALKNMAPATSVLLDTFFPTTEVHDSEYIDIDIVDKTGRKMAPFVSPKLEGKVIADKGYATRSYKPPYVKPFKITTSEDLLKRSPGYSIYDPNDSPVMRASRKLGEDMVELRELITRRMEWMASQLLEGGVVNAVGDGINEVIDFGMKATHKITATGTGLWTDAASDPIQDLETWCQLCGTDSGVYPTDCFFGSDVLSAFRKNANVKTYLNSLRINIGQMAPAAPGVGARFIMHLDSAGIDIWTYAESFFDEESSSLKPFVPAKKLFLGSRNAYTRRHFGAIKDLEFTDPMPIAMFPKTWTVPNPSARYVMLESAPLVAAHQIDAFACAQVVA